MIRHCSTWDPMHGEFVAAVWLVHPKVHFPYAANDGREIRGSKDFHLRDFALQFDELRNPLQEVDVMLTVDIVTEERESEALEAFEGADDGEIGVHESTIYEYKQHILKNH